MQDSRIILRVGANALKAYVFVVALFASGMCMIAFHVESVSAQQSMLQQTIRPIECVYTSTQTGSGTVQDNTCEGQPIPSVTAVAVNGGRPVLDGFFSSYRADTLKVWINGQWYTHGIDSRLTTEGDGWRLNLSGLNTSLLPGMYTVMVESQVDGHLLLRNTDAAKFEVVVTSAVPPIRYVTPADSIAPFFTRLITPQTQEAVAGDTLPRLSLPKIVSSDQPDGHSVSSSALGPVFRVVVAVFAVALLLISAVGGVLYYFLHKM